MNIGGDPGQDDYGLPPVDIEVPDDARELDRDVQAYHRELRMRRRQRIFRRLHEPLTRDGMVLPLLACCLALTLLAGTLLTVFAGGQGAFTPQSPRVSASPTRQLPAPGRVGGFLPDTIVVLAGEEQSVRTLTTPAVLALVPPGCRCQAALRSLSGRATSAGAHVYLVGVKGAQTAPLTRQASLPSGSAVQDNGDGLADAYHPAGLTAVFVRADGTVASIVRSGQAAALDAAIRAMTQSGPGASGSPAASGASPGGTSASPGSASPSPTTSPTPAHS